MLPNVIDIVEQFPLSFNEAAHELGQYSMSHYKKSCDGTSKIAADLGIKHPVLRNGEDVEAWTPTTDLLIVFSIDGACSLLAVADKPTLDIEKQRTKQLLNLEREYWLRRGAEWLLLTPNDYDRRVGLSLSRTAPWVFLKFRATLPQQRACVKIVEALEGESLTRVLSELEQGLKIPMLHAQCVLWQSVWSGITPLDLRCGHRPSEPVHLLPTDEFIALNPLSSRRSAWRNY